MQKSVHLLGKWAEQRAWLLLQQHGYQLVRKNFHSRFGEIDLIVKHDQILVFVEVKARSMGSYARASEVISVAQQRRIIKTAQLFLQYSLDYVDYACRFDVICFDFPQKIAKKVQLDFSKLQYDLQWIESAFMLN